VTVGVDPHKASHTAAVLDKHGQLLGREWGSPDFSEGRLSGAGR
jgi:hypothetical protein